MDVLKDGAEEALQILNDPEYRDDAQKALQRQKLESILKRIFDFKEFSRLVLTSSDQAFSAGQREEFADVFEHFLSNFYIGQLQKRYQDEKVQILSQEMINESKAVVSARVETGGLNVPLKIWMTRRSGIWKFYNVDILGINAVSFYRSQIQLVLQKKTLACLIRELRERVAVQEKLSPGKPESIVNLESCARNTESPSIFPTLSI
jgi:phospholipid transport system substrate-binding protein